MGNLVATKSNSHLDVLLDRPEALNSLNFQMLEALDEALTVAELDPDLRFVWIEGAGDKAFCAGGDVKVAREAGLQMKQGKLTLEQATAFFDFEYTLNKRLFHFDKPLIAWMDGITMGGGVGIAGPARFRIATEKTIWAMPEVTIGFFPDIGAAYYLTRAPGKLGWYLALTGTSISSPAVLLHAGFATHVIQRNRKEDLRAALLKSHTEYDVKAVLDECHTPPQEGAADILPLDKINDFFSGKSVHEILARLEKSSDPWAQETAKTMRAKSPTSLCVTFEHLNRAAQEEFDTIIDRDLTLARACVQDHDIAEGIRAQLVDKDKNPKWNPATLDLVKPEKIASYFQK